MCEAETRAKEKKLTGPIVDILLIGTVRLTLGMMVLVMTTVSPFAWQMHAHIHRVRSVTWKQMKEGSASVALESTFRDVPMIIGNKTFFIELSRQREKFIRDLFSIGRGHSRCVSPLCTYIFDRRPTDLCHHVASSDLTRRFLTLARRLQGHFDSIIFISLFLSCLKRTFTLLY